MEVGRVYRLPTEIEWEYACRGGASTTYHYGDDVANLHQFAWFEKNSPDGPNPVGKKLPNGFALHDTHGNVWEWCGDESQATRIFRGGSYKSDAVGCRSANRDVDVPSKRSGTLGFRVALNMTVGSN
jgi:formylglycine-generating enzyme required for sulfatase activity